MPDVSTARADAALVFDYASAWAWETQPQGRDFSYFRLVFETYRGLRRLGHQQVLAVLRELAGHVTQYWRL